VRVEIRVVYDDGTEEVIQAGRPAALIAFADEFEKVAPDGVDVMREAAWLAHRALRTDEPFEAWIDRVAEIDRPQTVGVDLAVVPAVEGEAVLEGAGEAEAVLEPDPTAAEGDETVVLDSGSWPGETSPTGRTETRTESRSPV
jgi:hypothetical protein